MKQGETHAEKYGNYEEWRVLSDSTEVVAIDSNSFVQTNKLTDGNQNSFVPTNKLAPVEFKIDADFPITAFMSIGFSHHYAIVSKVKDLEQRKFYIQFAADTKVKVEDFFNRELSALVCVELKNGPFKTAYLGQLAGYLRLLDDEVRKPNENPSIGILLCKSANKKFVEYVIQDYDKPMGVATYKTAADMDERLRRLLPSVDELERLL